MRSAQNSKGSRMRKVALMVGVMSVLFLLPLLVINFAGDATSGWTDRPLPEMADELIWLVIGLLGLGSYAKERRTHRREHRLLTWMGVAAGGLLGLLGTLVFDAGASLLLKLLGLLVMMTFGAAAAYQWISAGTAEQESR